MVEGLISHTHPVIVDVHNTCEGVSNPLQLVTAIAGRSNLNTLPGCSVTRRKRHSRHCRT